MEWVFSYQIITAFIIEAMPRVFNEWIYQKACDQIATFNLSICFAAN